MWFSRAYSSLLLPLLLEAVRGQPQGTANQAQARCKNIPGSPGWPSDAEWAKLSQQVGGRLLKPPAPAAACHRNVPSQGAPSCAQVTAGWETHDFHINHPTSTLWQLWNNYSCPVSAASPCSTKGYPVYVVAAQEWGDVKAAVDFARTKNIRLNIKATGHDFLGRSVQPNSLSIWTRRLRGMKWFDLSFKPAGCNKVINGPAVTVAAGHTWGEVYAETKRKGVSVVGGYTDTVGIAGFLSNGGHGELSAKYGFGADMVLQIELVTADGQLITANECQNSDIFWAMRGGGGSTYGVGITYTLQALRAGNLARYVGIVTGWEELYRIHSAWNRLASVGASGYINGHPARTGQLSLTVYLANSTAERLRTMVLPVLSAMAPRGLVKREPDDVPGEFTEYQSYEAMRDARGAEEVEAVQRAVLGSQERPATGTGASKIIASWLWSAKDVQSGKLRAALHGAYETSTQMMTDATMGVGTQNPPYVRGGGNAVNPALRTAIMRAAAEIHWEGTDQNVQNTKFNAASRATASLRSLAPEGGTYANEADPTTKDWQRTFWGANYAKLLQIKRKVDPGGLFYCRMCVGSEYMEDNRGTLCYKQ